MSEALRVKVSNAVMWKMQLMVSLWLHRVHRHYKSGQKAEVYLCDVLEDVDQDNPKQNHQILYEFVQETIQNVYGK